METAVKKLQRGIHACRRFCGHFCTYTSTPLFFHYLHFLTTHRHLKPQPNLSLHVYHSVESTQSYQWPILYYSQETLFTRHLIWSLGPIWHALHHWLCFPALSFSLATFFTVSFMREKKKCIKWCLAQTGTDAWLIGGGVGVRRRWWFIGLGVG